MDTTIKNFLKSGLLEKYIVGSTTELETNKVEGYIEQYTEIKEEYNLLQVQLELAARSNAVKPPVRVFKSILGELDSLQSVFKIDSFVKKSNSWYNIAASIAVLLFAGYSFTLYNQNQELIEENNTIVEEIFDLRNDISQNNNKLDYILSAFNKLNNPETEKYVLRGNERAKDLKTVAYINSIDKSSLIDVVSLPEISDEQTYQMWANLEDRKVNLGTLDRSNGTLKSVPYIEDALSLSITIESKNANNIKSSENSVAEIPIKNHNH